MITRFVFGAAISAAAALITIRFGHKVGGLFLAFPAILPASLTLIAEKEGTGRAAVDAVGATLGGFGLAAFALVAALTLGRLPLALAMALALVAWVVVAVGLYFATRRLLGGAAKSLGSRPAPQ